MWADIQLPSFDYVGVLDLSDGVKPHSDCEDDDNNGRQIGLRWTAKYKGISTAMARLNKMEFCDLIFRLSLELMDECRIQKRGICRALHRNP
ncbi:hypothetical protein U1Q18_036251 [Sarracenia purpurea var. burkii]